MQQLKKKREAYEQTYKAEEGKLSGLYREQKERQEMLQNLQRDMNNHSQPDIPDKLLKACFKIGIGVAALMSVGLWLLNITHLDASILMSGIAGSILMGALVSLVIGHVWGNSIAAKELRVRDSLTRKYNTINAELQQINQEIGKIEPRKKENDAICASIDHLEKEMEALWHKLYSNTNKVQ